ncbi:PREDICTED: uncharacterized protein LOC109581969 [Amphimedon queenslandica]|uniref:Uncharacterized protein n=1 Tax=Amphimedon queenslandica TaxID=400682 RepID=A0AAN0J5Q1_AMPQE|nr:PREDICTED: uncharacterized protein LOC109581969 [Amphimedon queenslandica]|eukprot:XP_019852058.1 PREDICTED: uncharacterized protein LOC109581969 [Amphimedon queenslandica]
MLTEVFAIPSDIVIGLYLVSLPNPEFSFLQENLGNSLLKIEKLKELTLRTKKTDTCVSDISDSDGRPLKRICIEISSAGFIRSMNLAARQSSFLELTFGISMLADPNTFDLTVLPLFEWKSWKFIWYRKNNSLTLRSNHYDEFFAEHLGVMSSKIQLSSFTLLTYYKKNIYYLSCKVTVYSKSETSNLSDFIKVINDYNSYIERIPLDLDKQLFNRTFEHHTVTRKCHKILLTHSDNSTLITVTIVK